MRALVVGVLCLESEPAYAPNMALHPETTQEKDLSTLLTMGAVVSFASAALLVL